MEEDSKQLLMSLFDSRRWPPAFPTPVSISQRHLPLLKVGTWLFSPKFDGVRKLLLFGQDQSTSEFYVAIIERSGSMELRVLSPSKEQYALFSGTVIDCELVNGKYYAFDVYFHDGFRVSEGLSSRLSLLGSIINGLPISLHLKQFYPLSKREISCPDVAADGLIIAYADGGWNPGRQEKYFKWKPKERITVDVRLEKDRASLEDALCPLRVNPSTLSGVVECKIDDDMTLTTLHERRDKSTANSLYVFNETIKNYKEAITQDQLHP